MPSYLVTGGAGFIGSHIVEALVKEGERVRVFDNFSTGKAENLSAFAHGIELINGDVRNSVLCRRAMEDVEYVIHLAALHEVPRSVEKPLETHEINVTGILNLLLSAREAGIKRFVFSSSSAVYGDHPVLPRSEEMIPSPTSSPYATSKLLGEHYCRLFSHLYGLETVCLRFFNIYGPRQDSASDYAGVIPKFISALLSHTPPTIYGDGEQTRDFTYVADCVAATLAACHASGLHGIPLNIGAGRQTSVNQLYHLLQEMLNQMIPAVYGPPQAGDIKHDRANVEKARQFLAFEPKWDIRRGLMETIQWYREKKMGSVRIGDAS